MYRRPMTIPPREHPRASPWLIRLVWFGAIALAALGVTSALARAFFIGDFGARIEPARESVLDALGRRVPLASQRPAETAAFDRRFGEHRLATLLHIVPGAAFLLLAPLQFSARIRRRHPVVHRRSGRALLVVATIGGVSGVYFGLLMPYGGWGEALAIALFGGLFLAAVAKGYLAIRARQIARHREWMIRVFALAVAISTVRIVAGLLDIALAPAGISPRTLFVISLWTGWITTIAAAEWWIRRTRSAAPLHSESPLATRPGV